MRRIAEQCDTEPVFIFYFYSNAGDCSECTRQGYVLTELQQEYPQLRVYAFDSNLDLSALDTPNCRLSLLTKKSITALRARKILKRSFQKLLNCARQNQ